MLVCTLPDFGKGKKTKLLLYKTASILLSCQVGVFLFFDLQEGNIFLSSTT